MSKLIALLSAALFLLIQPAAHTRAQQSAASQPLLAAPIWVYNAWSAYDELSDNIPLTEELALQEFDQILRLRKLGVHFDYYMMDAFWYAPDGGYRKWRAESWPQGPDRWLAECQANGVKPGLWFSTNTLTYLHAAPEWQGSLDRNDGAMALYAGGFLADFMDVLQYWYDRGIRMFKFDFADFDAAAKGDEKTLTPHDIRVRNLQAFHAALQAFRRKNPDVVLVGFNGLVGDVGSAAKPVTPFDAHWLDLFDSLYSGDPRPSNVPAMNFWRSVDIYSDHMVRSMEQAGLPLQRINSTSFMIGDTGTNYHRGTAAWQGSLLLMVAHGGWINTVHGNLELLDDEKARWFAKVQAMYGPLQRSGITKSFGGIPGDAQPYGFGSIGADGALYTVVNPSQRIRTIRMPRLSPANQPYTGGRRILFRDAGFNPALDGDSIRLGPGQLALVGFGRYASPDYDLGTEADVRIPRHVEPLPAEFAAVKEANALHSTADPGSAAAASKKMEGPLAIEAVVTPPVTGDLRIILRQRDTHNEMMRSVSKTDMGKHFVIAAEQGGRPLPVEIHYDKVIWSGLSWAVGEIRHADIAPHKPIRIRLSSAASDPSLHLDGQVFRVEH